MWYDATSAAGSVEDPGNSKVAGKVGYVRAPVQADRRLRLAVVVEPRASTPSPSTRTQAWEFVKWATSKEYAKLVGSQLGWSRTPPGTRKSTYEIPEYIEAGGEFAPLTAKIMYEVNPEQAGRQSAAVGRHPVRDDPGVPRRRQPDLPAASPTPSPAEDRSIWPSTRARRSPSEPASNQKKEG